MGKYWDETTKWLRKTLVANFAEVALGRLWEIMCEHKKIRKVVEKYPSSHFLGQRAVQKWAILDIKPKIATGDLGRRF
jgi:hypothetical protein